MNSGHLLGSLLSCNLSPPTLDTKVGVCNVTITTDMLQRLFWFNLKISQQCCDFSQAGFRHMFWLKLPVVVTKNKTRDVPTFHQNVIFLLPQTQLEIVQLESILLINTQRLHT